MWILKDSAEKITYLQPNETFRVGRKSGHLVVNDDSISRNHAEIIVTFEDKITETDCKNESPFSCKIRDLGSKYGTFISKANGPFVQVGKNPEILEHTNKIRFGIQNAIYTVIHIPMMTATSGLDNDEKKKLKNIMDVIGGRMSSSLEKDCAYMTISKPIVSMKLACALAAGMHIVTMAYWECVLKNVKANENLPNPDNFAGEIENQFSLLGNVSIRPNPCRSTIFKGLTFVHYDSKQYALFRDVIKYAGGKSLILRPQNKIDVCGNGVVVVQMVESNTTQATGTGDGAYMNACEELGKARRRAIPSTEIPLAIIHCSTEKYCNPQFDFANIFKERKKNDAPKSKVLAPDTQDFFSLPKKIKLQKDETCNWVVPETVEQHSQVKTDFHINNNILESQNDAYCRKIDSSVEYSQSQCYDPSMKILSISEVSKKNLESSRMDTEQVGKREEESKVPEKKFCIDFFNDKDGRPIEKVEKSSSINKRSVTPESMNNYPENEPNEESTVKNKATSSETSNVPSSLSESRKIAKSPTKSARSPRKSRKISDSPEPGQRTIDRFLSPTKNASAKGGSVTPVVSKRWYSAGGKQRTDESHRTDRLEKSFLRTTTGLHSFGVKVFKKQQLNSTDFHRIVLVRTDTKD